MRVRTQSTAAGDKTTKDSTMTRPTPSWLSVIMPFMQWFDRFHQSSFSVEEQELIQFRRDLDQCSEDQKIRVMTLIVLYYPSMSSETNYVCKAYYNTSRSFFLRKWRNETRKVEDKQFSYLYYQNISYQIRELFMQIDSSQRGQMMHRLLLTSPSSITKKIISIYMYYMWMMFNTEELDVVPPHWHEADKQRLMITLSHSPSLLTRRIFSLHQQLVSQIMTHFQQMMSQMCLNIDAELERLLQETILPLVHDNASTNVGENHDSDVDWDIEDVDEFEDPDSE